ncbi:MAG: amino acid ABC transporter permease [Candidatus Thorarchaeota archaeon]|nr:MAG: amino acid ABC transporter permease [Candidatus Thorarchaeota archaeon]
MLQMDIIDQLQRIAPYTPDLVNGFLTSMGMYIFALFFGLVLGIVLAVGRHYGGAISSRICTAFIEFMRGTPLLAQILAVGAIPAALNAWLISQGMAPIDTSWRVILPDIVGVPRTVLTLTIVLCSLTLGLNSAAYQAEFFRGSLSSLSAGQTLAAQSIGMTKRQEIRYIALPQSLRRAIPAWSNEAVYLPKYTTVAYMVGVAEFFAAAKLIVARTFLALTVYALVAIIFLVLITFITWLVNRVYERVKIPGM